MVAVSVVGMDTGKEEDTSVVVAVIVQKHSCVSAPL